MLVPVGTAAAAHLFGGAARPRALGVVGALTFLGMAAGPVVGAAILASVHPAEALAAAGMTGTAAARPRPGLALGLLHQHPDRDHRDRPGLGGRPPTGRRRAAPGGSTSSGRSCSAWPWSPACIGLTLLGSTEIAGTSVAAGGRDGGAARGRGGRDGGGRRARPAGARPVPRPAALPERAVQLGRARLAADRAMRSRPRSSAARCSSTGSCTAARTTSGWRSGRWPARPRSARSPRASSSASCRSALVALVGIGLSIVGLVLMSRWTSAVEPRHASRSASAIYGFGFGLTVTPRSTAAVEAAGRRAFGTASAVVTVARMLGMAVGLAILTAYGSTTIDRLYDEVYATPDAYQQFIPESLRDRPLRDPFVVGALEEWASREAASIMVGLFVVAAGVTAVAIPPALALGGPRAEAGAYAGRRIGRERRDRQDRRRRTRRRWPRPHRTRPRPLTRSPDIPLGVRVQRQGATGPAGQPGTIRVVALKGGELHELEGADALAKLPELVAEARLRGLGRSRRPDAEPGPAGRRGPRAPPADHRGRARGQPAGQDRDDRRASSTSSCST